MVRCEAEDFVQEEDCWCATHTAVCEAKDYVQAEDCWCATHTAVCEAGQVCEEEEEKCRDIVLCEDPRTKPGVGGD